MSSPSDDAIEVLDEHTELRNTFVTATHLQRQVEDTYKSFNEKRVSRQTQKVERFKREARGSEVVQKEQDQRSEPLQMPMLAPLPRPKEESAKDTLRIVTPKDTLFDKRSASSFEIKSPHHENDIARLREEVHMMRIRTLYQMVDELRVLSGGRTRNQRVVWLTNKQANLFTPNTMVRLLGSLGISIPPSVIVFIRSGKHTKSMVENGGRAFMTRVKYDCEIKDTRIIHENDLGRIHDMNKLLNNAVDFKQKKKLKNDHKQMLDNVWQRAVILEGDTAEEQLQPGDKVLVREEDAYLSGQIIDYSNEVTTVLFDQEVLPLQIAKNKVAPTQEDIDKLERRIALFVSESLMPLIIRTGGLVVCEGTTKCSLCVSIGKAFSKFSSPKLSGGGDGFSLGVSNNSGAFSNGVVSRGPVGASADKSGTNQAGSRYSHDGSNDQKESSTPGNSNVSKPRLLCIIRTPDIASAILTSGTNANSLFQAADRAAVQVGSPGHFLTEDYVKAFWNNANGEDHSAWMRYDIIDGATDLIMIDCKSEFSKWKDFEAHSYFSDILANLFTGAVPCMAVQFGNPDSKSDLSGLMDLISAGTDVMVLDSRSRETFKELKDKNGKIDLRRALEELEQWHRTLWKRGATEEHLASTLAFFHRVISQRKTGKDVYLENPSPDSKNLSSQKSLYETIEMFERQQKRGNVAITFSNHDSRENLLSMEAGQKNGRKRSRHLSRSGSKIYKDVTDFHTRNRLSHLKLDPNKITLEDLVTTLVDIHRANSYVSEKLNDLYMINMRDGKRGWELEVENTPEGTKLCETSIKDLAKECKRSHSGLWLRLYSLLKPAWEQGQRYGSDLFSGSLDDLVQVKIQLEDRLSLVERLPKENSLEELNALREAWNDVDRYEFHAERAKLSAKMSFIVMLLLGIASVTVATLSGAGAHTRGITEPIPETTVNSSLTSGAMSTLSNANSSTLENTIDKIAFGIAVFSTFFASYVAYDNPVQKWKQLRSAALQLRSEIWEFRTRTGSYNYSLQSNDASILRTSVESLRSNVLNQASVSSSTFFTQASTGIYKHGQYEFLSSVIKRKNLEPMHDPELYTFGKSIHVVDDYHSPVIPSMYIARRLEKTITFYQSRVKPYYQSKTICAVLLMLTSAFSAVLATTGLTTWISIVAVVGSSITSWSEFSGKGKKLGRYASAITTLRGIRLWWETLTTVEQANSGNVNALVRLTEDVINHDAKAWLATNQTAKSMSKAVAKAQGKG